MADFEKVYRVGFDASKAKKSVTGLLTQLNKFEKKIHKALGEATKKSAAKSEKAIDKLGRRGKKSVDKLGKGADKAARRIGRIGTAARKSSTSLSGLISKIALFIGAASGIRSIGRDFFEFDRMVTKAAAKFSKLDATMEPGRKGFKDFRKEMRLAARDVEHTAATVGGAANFWAKAGKSAQQTKAVIPITLDFASANEDAAGSALDAARAGDILSDTLGQFRLDSNDPSVMMANTARVADVMSAAANSANFSAEELFESYKEAGPVLSSVGGDIEQTSAYLAAMANAGVKGSRAGTALKIAITALNAPTAQQASLLEKYTKGVKDAEGNFRGLSTVVGELVESTKGLGTGERFEVLSKIIGRRGTAPFINLLVKGQVELDKLSEGLRGASGETKRLAEITRTSAIAQMQKFWGKITDLGFTVIEQTQLFGKLGKAIDGIDWVAAADFVIKDLVPALVWAGDVIKNTLWPAFKDMSSMLKSIFMPIINVLSSMFGGLSDEGGGLAKILGALGALMISSKVLGAIGRLSIGIGGATASLTGMGVAATTSAKLLGTVSAAAGVLQAAFAGWTIGSIIYDQLVKPLQDASRQAKSTRVHLGQIEEIGAESYTKGVLEKAVKEYDKKIAKQEEIRAGYLKQGSHVKDTDRFKRLQKRIDDLESKRKGIQDQIYIKKTRENVAKYGDGSTGNLFTQGETTDIVSDYEEDFSEISRQLEPIEIKVIPDPSSLDEFGQSVQSASDDFSMPAAGGFSGQVQGDRLRDQGDWVVDFKRRQRDMAIAQTDYYKKMLAANTGASKQARTVTQNLNVAGATVTVNAQGGDPREIARAVKRELKSHEREQAAALRQAAREAAPAEF